MLQKCFISRDHNFNRFHYGAQSKKASIEWQNLLSVFDDISGKLKTSYIFGTCLPMF